MAMDHEAMAALVKQNIEALPNFPADGKTANFLNEEVIKAICKGIVDHIKAAAQATGTTTVSGGSSAGSWPTAVPPGGIT